MDKTSDPFREALPEHLRLVYDAAETALYICASYEPFTQKGIDGFLTRALDCIEWTERDVVILGSAFTVDEGGYLVSRNSLLWEVIE